MNDLRHFELKCDSNDCNLQSTYVSIENTVLLLGILVIYNHKIHYAI